MSSTAFRIVAAGDSVLLLELEDRIDAAVNARAIRVGAAVEAAELPGVRDVVPTYRSVAVYFDPLRVDYDRLTSILAREAGAAGPEASPDGGRGSGTLGGSPLQIPVCYGGELGPDLAALAAFARLSEAEVVARHSAPIYRVFMMGFVPGFTYLGTVDPVIAMPRRASPRVRVPRGSVGVAGPQTGIYPADTPGGWQIIGRTPVKIFDPSRSEAFLVKPGDAIQFLAIPPDEYARAVH